MTGLAPIDGLVLLAIVAKAIGYGAALLAMGSVLFIIFFAKRAEPPVLKLAQRVAVGAAIVGLQQHHRQRRRLRAGKPRGQSIDAAEQFVDDRFGLPTVRDIFSELEKPGRDPRPSFVTASFTDGVEDITDLKPGMMLEGTVTNVAAFGAFVDIGVHQDGLVHVSQLADRFVKDPHEIVKTGQVVRVRVVEVDVPRKRIGLTMRKDGGASARQDQTSRGAGKASGQPKHRNTQRPGSGGNAQNGALGDALRSALKNR